MNVYNIRLKVAISILLLKYIGVLIFQDPISYNYNLIGIDLLNIVLIFYREGYIIKLKSYYRKGDNIYY